MKDIFITGDSFSALKTDGSFVQWGSVGVSLLRIFGDSDGDGVDDFFVSN